MPRKSLVSAVLAVMTLAACGPSTSGESTLRNVFGDDQRVSITDRSYPYGALALLDHGCSAALVGKRLALTAAHCVALNGAVHPSLGKLRIGVIGGTAGAESWIKRFWYGTDNADNDRGNDWAIVEIEEPLGDTLGYFGARSPRLEQLPYTLNLAGYSIDKDHGRTPAVVKDCAIRDKREARLLNDCDSMQGISGAPMFRMDRGVAYVVALAVSEYRNGGAQSLTVDAYAADQANVAISTDAFKATLEQLRRTVDLGQAAPTIAGVLTKENTNQRDPDQGGGNGGGQGGGNGGGQGGGQGIAGWSQLVPAATLTANGPAARDAINALRIAADRVQTAGRYLNDWLMHQEAVNLYFEAGSLRQDLDRLAVDGSDAARVTTAITARRVRAAADRVTARAAGCTLVGPACTDATGAAAEITRNLELLRTSLMQ